MLYEDRDFKIIRHRGGVVLIRKNMPYSFHSHFKDFKGAKQVLRFFKRKVIPYSPYFKSSIIRLTTEYERTKFSYERKKPKYVNKKRR